MAKFIGRQEEINKLQEIAKKKSASFIVVRGRRRIGKSHLKIDSLKYSKGYSCRLVLIHVNGITNDVIESDYFASIIDFSYYLTAQQVLGYLYFMGYG